MQQKDGTKYWRRSSTAEHRAVDSAVRVRFPSSPLTITTAEISRVRIPSPALNKFSTRSKMTRLAQAAQRYFRPTIACPEGQVTHFGDCSVYRARVCDCGLLRTLRPHVGNEDPVSAYPKFWDEWHVHEQLMHELSLDRITH